MARAGMTGMVGTRIGGMFIQEYAIYPDICPQEMGIISEMEAVRNQEKLKF